MTAITPRRLTVCLEDHAVAADIGFHDFEVGHPQRLLVTVRADIDPAYLPATDAVADAWNYDVLRDIVAAASSDHHYDLQETLALRIFELVSALPGVTKLSVACRKPDVYPDAAAVGISISSE